MERRGFFGSLVAALAAPLLPKVKPRSAVVTGEMIQTAARSARRCGRSLDLRREMVRFAESQKRFLAGRPTPSPKDESAWDYIPEGKS